MDIKKRGVAMMVVGGALLVLVVAYVGYVGDKANVPPEEPTATSTPSTATTTDIFDMEPIVPEAKVSTEGWKTCRNEEYGWEVQYPGEWYAFTGSRDTYTYIPESTIICSGLLVGFTNDGPNDDLKCTASECDGYYAFSIRIIEDRELLGEKTKNATSVESFVPQGMEYKRLQLKKDAIWISNTYPSRTSDAIWFLSNNDVYWIRSTNIRPDLMETILSTFHFFNTPSTTATSAPE